MKEFVETSSNICLNDKNPLSFTPVNPDSVQTESSVEEPNVPESGKKPNKHNWWREIAFLIGITILFVMVYHIGLDTIWKNIILIGWYVIPIIAVWGIGYILNALSWNSIIHDTPDVHIPFLKVLKFTISGYALNYITPFGLAGGEPYRIMELRRYMPTEKATSSVILYLMMHICSHYFFWLTAALLVAWLVPVSRVISILLTVSSVLFSCFIILFFKGYKQGLVVKITRIGSRVPFLGKRLRHLKPETIERLNLIDEQIRNLHGNRRRSFYFSLFLEFLARLVNSFEVLLIIYALGHTASYIDALIIVALSSLLANILFFSPMQLGTREGGFFLAFSLLGLATNISVSVSMITRIRELFWILIGILLMKVSVTDKSADSNIPKTVHNHA